MNNNESVFIKDDLVKSPYFADITEIPRSEALKLLQDSGQAGILPVDLKAICDFESVPLRFVHIEEASTAARFVQTKGEWYFEVDNEGNGETDFSANSVTRCRQRFSLAHEIGHYKFKSHCDPILQGALLSGHNPHAKGYLLQREKQATEFATELLLPINELKPLLKNLDFQNDFFQSVETIANDFETSITATVKRIASTLDIPVIAIHFAPDGKSHQLPSYSSEFKSAGFFFPKDGAIPDNSFAANMFDGKSTAAKGRKAYPDCTVWFSNKRNGGYKTVEWALQLGRFGIIVFLELIEADV